MNRFKQYRLPQVPDHFHFPSESEQYLRRILGGVESPSERLPDAIDLNHTIDGLRWHRIGPLLYANARKSGEFARMPDWLRNYLGRSSAHSSARNLAIGHELKRIVESFNAINVRAMLLKGSALMRGVYTQAGLRPMDDVDLMVADADLNRASECMVRLGYRAVPSVRRTSCEHHVKFVGSKRGGRPVVELHWRLSDQGPLCDLIPLGELWDRSVAAPESWGPARLPSRCDQILHAALHLAEHYGLPQLRWIADLHFLAQRVSSADEWQTVADRACTYHLQLVLAAALRESIHWFNTSIPPAFWNQLSKGLPPSNAAEQVWARCHAPQLVTFELQELQAIRTLHGQLAHILALLFPKPNFVRLRYRVPRGRAVWPYYLIRIGNGIRSGVQSVLSRPDST